MGAPTPENRPQPGQRVPPRKDALLNRSFVIIMFTIVGVFLGFLVQWILTGDEFVRWKMLLKPDVPVKELKSAGMDGFYYQGQDAAIYFCKKADLKCARVDHLPQAGSLSYVLSTSCTQQPAAFSFTTLPPRSPSSCAVFTRFLDFGSETILLAVDGNGSIWQWNKPDSLGQGLALIIALPLGGLLGLVAGLLTLMIIRRRLVSELSAPAVSPNQAVQKTEKPATFSESGPVAARPAARFAWWDVWYMAMAHPALTLATIINDPGASFQRALLWLAAGSILGRIAGLWIDAGFTHSGGFANMFYIKMALGTGTIFGILLFLLIIFIAWVTYRIARENEGTGTYVQTLYGLAASLSPVLLFTGLLVFPGGKCLIPLLLLYGGFVGVLSVKAAHQISMGKALFASSLMLVILLFAVWLTGTSGYQDISSFLFRPRN